MEILVNLFHGFLQVFQPFDLLMLFVGLLVGMAVSIMPGLGLVMGVVLALPFTYQMAIEPSVILLTAIYFAGTYAGCFTAILYRIPGEPMDVPMLWDGYTMAARGQPAKALGWALVAALIGGLVSSAVMVALAEPMSALALKFDSPDYFAAVFFGLTTVVALAGGSHGEFADQPVRRPAGRHRRHRQHLRHRPLHFRRADPARRRAAGRGAGRHVRPRRGAGAHRPGPADQEAGWRQQERRHALPQAARTAGHQDDAVPQHRPRHPARHRARAPAPPSPPSSPTASRSSTASAASCSAPACPRASWRRRSAPPPRSPATWCRCSRSACPAAARPRSSSPPSCCTACSRGRCCSKIPRRRSWSTRSSPRCSPASSACACSASSGSAW